MSTEDGRPFVVSIVVVEMESMKAIDEVEWKLEMIVGAEWKELDVSNYREEVGEEH